MKRNLPRDVTLIDKHYLGGASVVRLSSEGPKYWHGRSINICGDGEVRLGSSWRYERERYLLVEGQRWDLVERIQKASEAYRKATEQPNRDRRDAQRQFLLEWDDAHPAPELPKVEDIIQEVTGQ